MRYHEISHLHEGMEPRVVRVFHGSTEPRLILQSTPLFGVRDFGFAVSYAVYRSGVEQGYVHTLDFRFRKLADDTAVRQIADELGIEIDFHVVEIADQSDNDQVALYRAIVQHGYDGITGYDFGFRDDFEELMTWVVFDASVQATVVATKTVTKTDIDAAHRPDSLQ